MFRPVQVPSFEELWENIPHLLEVTRVTGVTGDPQTFRSDWGLNPQRIIFLDTRVPQASLIELVKMLEDQVWFDAMTR